MFRVLVLCAVAILIPVAASADEDMVSANWVMPGCRDAATETYSVAHSFKRGLCAGVVGTIIDLRLGICAPPRTTTGQVVRVVTQYIDARPGR